MPPRWILPDGEIIAYALFAHCFTCGKDVLAAKRIAVALAAKGIAVLRFDFTGLGSSEGDFANSTFSSNVADLVRAADHLRETRQAPALLIGHSLGGAAILAAAGQIPEAKAVVTIAAPSDPAHVTHLFKDHVDDIRKQGEVEVSLAGRPFRIKREFLDDVAEQQSDGADQNTAQGAADDAFADRRHRRHRQRHADFHRRQAPKELCLARRRRSSAERRRDAAYVADVIAAWAERYIEPDVAEPAAEPGEAPRHVVVRETRNSKFQQTVTRRPAPHAGR